MPPVTADCIGFCWRFRNKTLWKLHK